MGRAGRGGDARRSAVGAGVAAWRVVVPVLAACGSPLVTPQPGRADDPPVARVPVRVAAAEMTSVLDWEGDRPTGPMADIWKGLGDRLAFDTTFVRVPSVVEMLDLTRAGRIDVGLGPVAITEERERTLDLSHPVFHSGMRIVIRQKRDTGLFDAAWSLATWKLLGILLTLVAVAVLSGHLLWWFERGDNPESFPRGYRRGVGEALWWIASTVVTGGCDDKHVDGLLGRIIALIWMVGGIAVVAGATSVLTATMTAEQVAGVIHGPRDLAGRTVGIQTGAVTMTGVRQRGGLPREYATLREAVAALDAGEVEAVVGPNEILSALVTALGRPRLRVVGPLFDVFDFGIALPTGSPLREGINKALLRMREEGEIARIEEQWFGKHE